MDLLRGKSLRPTINIDLGAHSDGIIYTTSSAINGIISFRTHEKSKLHNAQILFTGRAKKTLELDRVAGQPVTEWCFLRLLMPLGESSPTTQQDDATFRQHHERAFHFRVPRRLPAGTCHHQDIDTYLQEHHHYLPPTLGTAGVDDMCPDLISVNYHIEVNISYSTRTSHQENSLQKRLAITILPGSLEEAPMNLDSQKTNYSPMADLPLRRNVFGPIIAHLRVKAHQPGAIMLSPNGESPSETAVYLSLAFESSDRSLSTPELKRVLGKIISNTYYGPRTLHEWPQRVAEGSKNVEPLLNYKVDEPVIACTPVKLEWVPDVSSDRLAGDAWTTSRTTLRIPFTISHSGKRTFLPTFHCCLFSRTYDLAIRLCLTGTKTIKVVVPVQIGVKVLPETQNESLDSTEPPCYDGYRRRYV